MMPEVASEFGELMQEIGLSFSLIVVGASVYSTNFLEELLDKAKLTQPKKRFTFLRIYRSSENGILYLLQARPLQFNEVMGLNEFIISCSPSNLLLLDTTIEDSFEQDLLILNSNTNTKQLLSFEPSELTSLILFNKQLPYRILISKTENLLGTTTISKTGLNLLSNSLKSESNYKIVFPKFDEFDIELFIKKMQRNSVKSMYT